MKNPYHNAIRDHVNLAVRRGKTASLIRYQIGSDEMHDPSLIAYRVYKNRADFDVVMVCAGTNAIWQPLPEREIYLPSPALLVALKRKFNQWT